MPATIQRDLQEDPHSHEITIDNAANPLTSADTLSSCNRSETGGDRVATKKNDIQFDVADSRTRQILGGLITAGQQSQPFEIEECLRRGDTRSPEISTNSTYDNSAAPVQIRR
jgi:hypothetical protein